MICDGIVLVIVGASNGRTVDKIPYLTENLPLADRKMMVHDHGGETM